MRHAARERTTHVPRSLEPSAQPSLVGTPSCGRFSRTSKRCSSSHRSSTSERGQAALGPLFVYGPGRDWIGLAAVATLVFATIWCALHRPITQRRRVLPFLALTAIVGVFAYPFPYPSSHDGHPSTLCFRLPFENEWTVFWGGDTKEENLNAGYLADRRYGLDFVVTENGKSHRGGGRELTDYFAYDREVLAPADGTVVFAAGDLEDLAPGAFDRQVEPYGNFVVLEVGEREFVFLADLRQGSIAVARGARVRAGDPIGRVGNSASSPFTPEPHLAVHLQDTPVSHAGEAIPWSFCNYASAGRPVDRGLPHGGIARDGTFLGEHVKPHLHAER